MHFGCKSIKLREIKMKLLISCFLSALLVGCATEVTQSDLRSANYGQQQYEKNTTSTINSYLSKTLIDPDSLRLRCNQPRKGWIRDSDYEPPSFGYVVLCGVNAKNRMGGYVGEEIYAFLFRNDRLIDVINKQKIMSEIRQRRHYDFAE